MKWLYTGFPLYENSSYTPILNWPVAASVHAIVTCLKQVFLNCALMLLAFILLVPIKISRETKNLAFFDDQLFHKSA